MVSLTYRCPYCQTTITVAEDMVGRTMVCPETECQRPIELEVRPARLVASTDGPPADAEHEVSAVDIDDEHEIEQLHPAMFRTHPLRFVALTAAVIAAATGAVWLAVERRWVLSGLATLAFAAGLGGFLVWWLRVVSTTLTVTSKRLILRRGILAKATTEVRHEDVRNLQVDQSFLQRLLGVGDLYVSSAGQDGIEINAFGIPRPDEVTAIIRSQQN